ncbi:MAG: SNF2-related protein [Deltaproteobacteria bacterium]|nr:SNF2-related protein [Deltaproteobacteria bacterium]
MLRDSQWKLKYTPDDGDLVRLFYVPALKDAERYDRLTGYFNAGALALAARGIEGLVGNGGRMRLIVGCTLAPPEIKAIERGEELRARVEQHLVDLPLVPPDTGAAGALELLAWMVARGYLDVKVAVPCDAGGKPVNDDGIFHEKAGIIEDRTGEKIAWNGSLNETAAGWRTNWESINVYTSWGPQPERVVAEESNFARIWANHSPRLAMFDVPEAVRRDLLRFLPADDALPERLKGVVEGKTETPPSGATPEPQPVPSVDLRTRVWAFIRRAPTLSGGGVRVGEATAAVTPWPHQVRAFERLYGNWPPKLLIADEVGLGKTIQAGLLLRQAWLAGRAQRILILAPKAVLGQWQIELREKFNLNWPIYDGRKLIWYPSPAQRGRHEREVGRADWHEEPAVIVSSQLMRRHDRADALLTEAEPWDLVVLDEAHHARRRGAGSQSEGGPNALLRLMRGLKERTQGLVLLTATPMQVHPVEVWDLLDLLGLPPEWTAEAFLRFFDDLEQPSPSPDAMERMARLFQAVERGYGPITTEDARGLVELSRLKANKVLRALRDGSSIPRRQLETLERRAAVRIVQTHTPIRRLVSRHTRELLRRYFKAGTLKTPIADRRVEDRFVRMSAGEHALYDAVEDYISGTYNQAAASERNAVGFVMTIYRRRLASSFRALGSTLQRHLDAVTAGSTLTSLDEDVPDDETLDEAPDTEEMVAMEQQVLAAEETDDIQSLLVSIRRLPPDSKLASLRQALDSLRADGYRQIMVFTQYTDTMDFLREELGKDPNLRLLCFSGRGGEVAGADGIWHRIGRDDAKRRFRDGEADLLLCTDAAAEGLNFQFCGALVNYDMPWNPMRVEQRIGRIDRLGQHHPVIRILNLHYEGTVETDVYRALRRRIGLFETVVGRLQPILAQLPRAIAGAVLSGRERERVEVVETIEQQASDAERGGFDLDAALTEDVAMPQRPPSPILMEDLDRVISSPALMPPGTEVQPMANREYSLLTPGMPERLRVTTDPAYYEQHAESVEFWSPGNPLFKALDFVAEGEEDMLETETLRSLLDERG